MSAAPTDERCTRHTDQPVGWECEGCKKHLCPQCTARKKLEATGISIDLCCLCGAQAFRLFAHRSVTRPYIERLLGAWRYPLNKHGVIAMVAVGLFMAGFSYLRGNFARVMELGAFWSYFLYIIRSSGNGHPTIDVPDFRDFQQDIATPAFKGGLVTSMFLVPALLYGKFVQEWSLDETSARTIATDPVIWLIVLACVAYAPVGFVSAATDVSSWQMLNPVRAVRAIRVLGRDYWIAVVALVALVPAKLFFSLVGGLVNLLPIPFITRWIAQSLDVYVPFVAARGLGLLLFCHGDLIDWGRPEEYQEAFLPGVEPRGPVPASTVGERRPSARPSIALDGAAVAGEGLPLLDLDLDPVPRWAAGGGGPSRVADAVAQENWAHAVALADADPDAGLAGLSPADLYGLGCAAQAAGKARLAARVFKIAAQARDNVAPNALFALAELYARDFRDPAASEHLYHEVVRRFPGSDAAAAARDELERLGP